MGRPRPDCSALKKVQKDLGLDKDAVTKVEGRIQEKVRDDNKGLVRQARPGQHSPEERTAIVQEDQRGQREGDSRTSSARSR